jgi:hypothetical protein
MSQLKSKQKYMIVPADLLKYAIQKKRVSVICIFLYLKFIASGHVTWSKMLQMKIAEDLQISVKSVQRHIKVLLLLKFITYNKPRSSIRTVSFKSVVAKIHGDCQHGVRIYYKDLINFRAFAFSGFIANEIRKFRHVVRSQKPPVLEERRSPRMSGRVPSTMSVFPVRAIAKKLKLSTSRVSQLKKIAAQNGTLSIKKNFKDINISDYEIPLYKKYMPEEGKKLRKINGKFLIQESDSIGSTLTIKKRRDLRKS